MTRPPVADCGGPATTTKHPAPPPPGVRRLRVPAAGPRRRT